MRKDLDRFQRFVFDDLGIRGEWVHLDVTWQTVLENRRYPAVVSTQLGQALAAALLLSGTIKFQGSLILQTQSAGPLHTLVAQATHQRTIRGLAHWKDEVPSGSLAHVFGPGRLVLTIQDERAEAYQGIVALEGKYLAEAIETYFVQSEQLATRLWLAADDRSAAGLLTQALPSQASDPDDWERITVLADTLSESELLNLPCRQLLYRLFNRERVRVFSAEPVCFRCGCARERIEAILKTFGQRAMESILEEQGAVTVTCEFCNRTYRFDSIDIHTLFADDRVFWSGRTKH